MGNNLEMEQKINSLLVILLCIANIHTKLRDTYAMHAPGEVILLHNVIVVDLLSVSGAVGTICLH